MANDRYYGNKNKSSSSSSPSVCEVSMLLVSNIIRQSCRSLFGSQILPPNYYSNDPPKQPQDHERLIAEDHSHNPSRKIKITQESECSVMATKPISYVVKPGHQDDEVGRTLTRYETDNDDVDVHASNYINQVREKINGN